MTTTGKGFRYPVYSDTPDVPRDLAYLAADVDAYLDAHPGPQGPSGTITIGTVSTVSASTPAAVTNVGTASAAILNLTLPRGIDGVVGGAGPSNILSIGSVTSGSSAAATISGTSPSQTLNLVLPAGPQGPTGAQGPAGPTTLAIGTTTTGTAGTNASVTNTGTSTNAVFAFTIPRGATGATGAQGVQGPAGDTPIIDPIPGTISLNIPTSSAYGVNSNWYPLANNLYSIGQPADVPNGVSSNKFWKTIYSNTGTISTSDLRLKTDILDSSLGLNFINDLRPVSYKFIEGSVTPEGDSIAGTRTHWGLISQEVKQALENSGVDFGGWVLIDKSNPESEQALRYEEFIAPLIKAVQELTARVKTLEEA